MKFILAIIFTLMPVIAIAEATAGYGFSIGNDPIALSFLASPIIGIIGAVAFTYTVKKLAYQGKSRIFAGLIGGISGAICYLRPVHDDMVLPTIISAFLGGFVVAGILGWLKSNR